MRRTTITATIATVRDQGGDAQVNRPNYRWSVRPALFAVVLVVFGCGVRPVVPPLPDGIIDGPYVIRRGNRGFEARWVQATRPDAQRMLSETVPRHRWVAVPPVSELPQFEVQLRLEAPDAVDELRVDCDAPIFVIADTHGEYEILVELLQRHGVIDGSLRWSFGKGRLAVLGDVLDRGLNQIEILWLLYRLEAEAANGGGVHLVLGNHEAMVLRGDLRYLNPKYVRSGETLGAASYAELVGPHTVLGQWLRSKPSVIRLNDLLMLHGGISPAVVKAGLTLEEVNQAVRSALSEDAVDATEVHGTRELVMGAEGPHWYRGYFALDGSPPAASPEDVEAVLRHFRAGTILIGHTAVPSITTHYEGKVIAVQVYPHIDEQTGRAVFEGLLIRGGEWYRAKVDGALELLQRSENGGRSFAAGRLQNLAQ